MSDVLRMGNKWEYLRIEILGDDAQEQLNELGMEGWEAFSIGNSYTYIYPSDESGTSLSEARNYYVYLKRPFSIVNRGSLVKEKLSQ